MLREEVQVNTIVVGAGPAGLAVGACLRQSGVPFLMLEQDDRVGAAWHGHYDRLHLHTNKGLSALPFYSFPAHYPRYPSRLQVIEYLEAYAEHFRLRPRFGQQVVSVHFWEGGWETQTRDTLYRSANLVIATGYARVPHVPQWPGQDRFSGTILHSAQYQSGRPFAGQRVLVVGFGNSGGEIAIDLWEHGARPCLAVRSPINVIPRELFGIPILFLASFLNKLPAPLADALTAPVLHAMYGDLTQWGLQKLPYGPLTQTKQDAQIPLIDVGTINLIRKGHIEVQGGIERFAGSEVVFRDGKRRPYDAVVLATGYRPEVDAFLEETKGVVDERGTPLQSGAEVRSGLFFCGFHVVPVGMLRAIAQEAPRIAEAIRARA